MPRSPRRIEPDVCVHVLNRGNGRQRLFHKEPDYLAFAIILAEAVRRYPVRLLSWCLMPNHWHLVLRPRDAAALAAFMRYLTVTHVRRHHQHFASPPGHLYQGRYKSFIVQDGRHFLLLCRYVEANALRARLVRRAEQWRWSSLHQRGLREGAAGARARDHLRGNGPPETPALSAWPVDRPRDWLEIVNEPLPQRDEQRVRQSIDRERPLGADNWVLRLANKLGLQQTLRPLGRPRKPPQLLSPRQRRRRNATQKSPLRS